MDYPRSLPEAITTIDELQARIDALESLVGIDQTILLQSKFKLPLQNARLLAALAGGQPKTKEQLVSALDTGSADWCPNSKLVHVLICRLRQKIWPFGFAVKTLWGSGYFLEGPLHLLAEGLDAPIVRGEYESPKHVVRPPFEKTKAGLILEHLHTEFTQGASFPLSPAALGQTFGFSPQSTAGALKRLVDMGYLEKMSKGSGWVSPIYRFTKNQKEKAA